MNASALTLTDAKPSGSTYEDLPSYAEFLNRKSQLDTFSGFAPIAIPSSLFDFQSALVDWAIRKGKAAIFADCGMGKTPMQLVWADNVVRHTNRGVLIVTPLAVSHQTIREGEKFGIECARSAFGKPASKITVTNYERLHLFDPADYAGMVCDESSILKNFDGKRRGIVNEFMRKLEYRLLCTATAAPNDYVELGTSSEALGYLGHMDMLTRFFRNQNSNAVDTRGHWRGFHAPRMFEQKQWRFKHHAEEPFWKWVCSWARALRKPSDLGFKDDGFALPPLIESEIRIDNTKPLPGWLFVREAVGLCEERQELRLTIKERCERVAELVAHSDPAVVWCHLNDEGKLLAKLIPDAVEISGSDSDEKKESAFLDFSAGNTRVIITKPKIGAFGLNWQHCAHVTFFASHSYEQYYQAVRRCWRFGQKRPVRVDTVSTGGSANVLENMRRKAKQADEMFSALIRHMNQALAINRTTEFSMRERKPLWL